MALPTLTPASNTSVSILPITGTAGNVNSATNPLPYGIYVTKAGTDNAANAFKAGAADQVSYVYQKMGGDILDIELSEFQVYAAYEEAVLEYSYLSMYIKQKYTMSDLLGNPTGTFDNDGEMIMEMHLVVQILKQDIQGLILNMQRELEALCNRRRIRW